VDGSAREPTKAVASGDTPRRGACSLRTGDRRIAGRTRGNPGN